MRPNPRIVIDASRELKITKTPYLVNPQESLQNLVAIFDLISPKPQEI